MSSLCRVSPFKFCRFMTSMILAGFREMFALFGAFFFRDFCPEPLPAADKLIALGTPWFKNCIHYLGCCAFFNLFWDLSYYFNCTFCELASLLSCVISMGSSSSMRYLLVSTNISRLDSSNSSSSSLSLYLGIAPS